MYLLIILTFNFFMYVHSLYLNKYQFTILNDIIKNPLTPNYHREKSKEILYKSFESWAIKQAYEFKKLHKYKCSNIVTDDLIIASKLGLFKAIEKYNGTNSFIAYAYIYIKSELLKALTEQFSLSIIPKSYRIKSKTNISNDELLLYKKRLSIKLIHHDNNWQFDKIYEKNNKNDILDNIHDNSELERIINIINISLTPFSKRVFFLKYNIDFKVIRSNRYIANLMCCSEEHIRKNLIESSNKIKLLLE